MTKCLSSRLTAFLQIHAKTLLIIKIRNDFVYAKGTMRKSKANLMSKENIGYYINGTDHSTSVI